MIKIYYAAKIYKYYLPFIVKDAEDIPINKDVWAFSSKGDGRALNYIHRPTKGRIKDDKYFYEYKVNGRDLKKNGISLFERYFADTYDEAVEGFNTLVQNKINSLNEEIEKLEHMLVIKDKSFKNSSKKENKCG